MVIHLVQKLLEYYIYNYILNDDLVNACNTYNNAFSSRISDIYVGNDGKLHKTTGGGADTVLNFNKGLTTISYPEFILYSSSNINIPINGNTISFNMQTVHPLVYFYIDKMVNGSYTNIFTQNANVNGGYTGTKSFNISNATIIRFRTTSYGSYSDNGRIAITNINVS